MTKSLLSRSIFFVLSFIVSAQLFVTPTQALVTDGLIGNWHLDETSGTTAADSSGNNLTGNLGGGTTWVSGQLNGGISTDGVNDNATVSTSTLLDRANASVTVSFWMKRNADSVTYAGLVCKRSGSWCAYGVDRPANPRVLIRNSSGAASYPLGFTTDESVWTHVVFSIEDNGSTTTIRGYKNGTLQSTTSNAIRIGSYATYLAFGQRDVHYFSGSMDEVKIYDRVLSDSEVTEVFNEAATPEPSPSPSPSPTPEPTPSPSPSPTPDPNEPFTIAVLPDTQWYSRYAPEIFTSQTTWLRDNKLVENIAYVLHEGDVVDVVSDTAQWISAKANMNILDGVLPYTIALGNHDFSVTDARSSTSFNTYFPVSEYQNLPTFGGVYEAGKHDNSYYFFNAGGMDFMVVSLEFGPRDAVLTWANQLITDHPNHKVIILTHDYLYHDNTWHGSLPTHQYGPEYWSLTDANNGLEIWENLVKLHSNIVFVFSGHVHTATDGAGTLVSVGDYGNKVYQMMANYQEFANGGNGYLRLVNIDPVADSVDVKTYSPYLDQFMTDSENQFAFTNVIFGEADTTPPSVPDNLQLGTVDANQVQLSWSASSENESELAKYNVYRDSVIIGSPTATQYTDTQVTEGQSYSYTVTAVNVIDLESAASSAVVANIPTDSVAPSIASLTPLSETEVEVVFNEAVNEVSAEDTGHYSLDNNVTVSAATLAVNETTVLLTVSSLSAGTNYVLTINGVTDLAATPNVMSNVQANFGYNPLPTAGLLGYWNLDETSGVVADDLVGTNNASFYNNFSWLVGKILGGVNVDGLAGYGNIPFNAQFNRVGQPVTVAFWMKREIGGSSYAGLVCKRSGSWCAYGMDRPENPRVLIRGKQDDGVTRAASYSAGFTVTPDEWTHVAFSIEDTGTNTTIRMYKNGVLANTVNGALRLNTTTDVIYFGRKRYPLLPRWLR